MYGLSFKQLNFANYKIKKQKDYLSSNSFVTSNGQIKSFLDVSMAANFSDRYYSRLLNKVNTIHDLSINQGLIPVFLTVTLSNHFHDLIFGRFNRLTDFDLRNLPNNDRFGYLRDKAVNKNKFTVNDLYKIIRYQWFCFLTSRIFRSIRKLYNINYLFAVEPHKSGVPHAHILLYVPKDYINSLKKTYIRIFNAPMNITQNSKKLTFEQIKNGEINGFQWSLKNPVGYILKYVFKSFIDIKNKNDLDYLQAWYIINKIVRFTTSRSLIPQWVYDKIYPLEDNWYYLSTFKNSTDCEWSKEDNFFQIYDNNLDKLFKYDNGLYQIFIKNKLVHQFGEKQETIKKSDISFRVDYKPVLKSKNRFKSIPITFINVDNEKSYMLLNYKNELVNSLDMPVSKMCDYVLFLHYQSLDVENCNLHHFGLVKNELIKRGLLFGDPVSLNDFNIDFPKVLNDFK